jgi:hypothetical protein
MDRVVVFLTYRTANRNHLQMSPLQFSCECSACRTERRRLDVKVSHAMLLPKGLRVGVSVVSVWLHCADGKGTSISAVTRIAWRPNSDVRIPFERVHEPREPALSGRIILGLSQRMAGTPAAPMPKAVLLQRQDVHLDVPFARHGSGSDRRRRSSGRRTGYCVGVRPPLTLVLPRRWTAPLRPLRLVVVNRHGGRRMDSLGGIFHMPRTQTRFYDAGANLVFPIYGETEGLVIARSAAA